MDRRHLAQIYFEHVAPRRAAPTYYNLLHHLAEDRSDELAWRALKRVRQAIERQFGPHFELINDFYSYRSARQRIFPNWHQVTSPAISRHLPHHLPPSSPIGTIG